MDNVYRRDHEMPYIADGAVTSQQKETKKAIREYNEAMPFDLEKGMECLERAGIKHKENVYFEPPFYCEYGNHIEVGENFYANTHCVMLENHYRKQRIVWTKCRYLHSWTSYPSGESELSI